MQMYSFTIVTAVAKRYILLVSKINMLPHFIYDVSLWKYILLFPISSYFVCVSKQFARL